MKTRRAKIDTIYIERRNSGHKHNLEESRRFVEKCDIDPDRKERFKACECLFCFGGSRIGTAACTFGQCGLCTKELTCGNSAIDVLCLDCAKRSKLCKHCGADIDWINRRKRDLVKLEYPSGS